MKGIAIIGCGLIGQKRAKLIQNLSSAGNENLNLSSSRVCEALSRGDLKLIACVDKQKERADQLANQFPDCKSFTEWQEVIKLPPVNIIIIATLHASLAEIAFAALQAGKHVLIEKPAGKHSTELEPLIQSSKDSGAFARVGFNHRYHRAFRKARELVDQDELGELMFIRGRYGHGGRIGYDKEWRADKKLSGGGELIDQGVHLIDLARWFLGDFSEIDGHAHTYYWNMPVDDNGFLLLKTPDKKTAFLHASCTEWKNTFSFEIYGKKGKIDINGLGGSYGTEKIIFYKMLPQMGPPETYSWEFPMADD